MRPGVRGSRRACTWRCATTVDCLRDSLSNSGVRPNHLDERSATSIVLASWRGGSRSSLVPRPANRLANGVPVTHADARSGRPVVTPSKTGGIQLRNILEFSEATLQVLPRALEYTCRVGAMFCSELKRADVSGVHGTRHGLSRGTAVHLGSSSLRAASGGVPPLPRVLAADEADNPGARRTSGGSVIKPDL